MEKINIEGAIYFYDVNDKILYNDYNKKSGRPFNYLTEREKKYVEKQIRFAKEMV